jgi:S1-C subfamily serine protease
MAGTIARYAEFSESIDATLRRMLVETLLEQLFFTTVYIETSSSDGKGSGTGFVYNVQTDENQYAAFVVTNKHVIRGADAAQLRVLAAKDSSSSEPLLGAAHYVNLNEPEKHFVGHPDENVDVAVAVCSPWFNLLAAQGNYVFVRALTSTLAMNDMNVLTLDALEEVTFIGYPNGLYDQVNYLPIARRGHTATPPSVDYGGQPVFLVDASVFPGSSGSPVLLAQTGTFATRNRSVVTGQRLMLLGIIAAVYQRAVPVLQVPTGMASIVHDAIDIGIVYKSKSIDETVDLVLAQHGLQRYSAPAAEPVAQPSPEQDALAQ